MKFVKTLLVIISCVVALGVAADVTMRIIADGLKSGYNRRCNMCKRLIPSIDAITLGADSYCTTCVGVIMESQREYDKEAGR